MKEKDLETVRTIAKHYVEGHRTRYQYCSEKMIDAQAGMIRNLKDEVGILTKTLTAICDHFGIQPVQMDSQPSRIEIYDKKEIEEDPDMETSNDSTFK